MITLSNVTARIAGKAQLSNINLTLKPQENWVVLGANGSGKTALGQLLCSRLEVLSGTADLPQKSASVTFEDVTQILEREQRLDESDHLGGYDPGTSTRTFIAGKTEQHLHKLETLEKLFNLGELLDRGIKFLSTGEMRKALICRALMEEPQLLVLDEPFDGLDQASCRLLKELISRVIKEGTQVVLLLNRFDEIPPLATHIAIIQNCQLIKVGPKQQILSGLKLNASGEISRFTLPEPVQGTQPIPPSHPPIKMTNVHVGYRGKTVLNDFNWTVKPNENWMISGANGSGKTTLLNLITGDNTQAYRNGIELFGQQKGSGESIWDIKRRIGHISTAFQRNYRAGGRAINVVLSGFYDSIGLYATPTRKQQQQAQKWLQLVKLEHKARAPFQRLSFGEQRLVLLARAMIKTPELLILDEPCQGLDEDNRQAILQAIDQIGTRRLSQILYVTHHPEDELICINRHLKLIPCLTGGSTAVTERL